MMWMWEVTLLHCLWAGVAGEVTQVCLLLLGPQITHGLQRTSIPSCSQHTQPCGGPLQAYTPSASIHYERTLKVCLLFFLNPILGPLIVKPPHITRLLKAETRNNTMELCRLVWAQLLNKHVISNVKHLNLWYHTERQQSGCHANHALSMTQGTLTFLIFYMFMIEDTLESHSQDYSQASKSLRLPALTACR